VNVYLPALYKDLDICEDDDAASVGFDEWTAVEPYISAKKSYKSTNSRENEDETSVDFDEWTSFVSVPPPMRERLSSRPHIHIHTHTHTRNTRSSSAHPAHTNSHVSILRESPTAKSAKSHRKGSSDVEGGSRPQTGGGGRGGGGVGGLGFGGVNMLRERERERGRERERERKRPSSSSRLLERVMSSRDVSSRDVSSREGEIRQVEGSWVSPAHRPSTAVSRANKGFITRDVTHSISRANKALITPGISATLKSTSHPQNAFSQQRERERERERERVRRGRTQSALPMANSKIELQSCHTLHKHTHHSPTGGLLDKVEQKWDATRKEFEDQLRSLLTLPPPQLGKNFFPVQSSTDHDQLSDGCTDSEEVSEACQSRGEWGMEGRWEDERTAISHARQEQLGSGDGGGEVTNTRGRDVWGSTSTNIEDVRTAISHPQQEQLLGSGGGGGRGGGGDDDVVTSTPGSEVTNSKERHMLPAAPNRCKLARIRHVLNVYSCGCCS